MMSTNYNPNPKLDLVLERVVDLPAEKIWEAWTTPEHIKVFFCPRPWQVVDCKLDLRPGGIFYTKMRGPEGEEFPSAGCYLEIVKNEKLVWTDALTENYRPSAASFFTGMILLDRVGDKTKYTAIAIHKDEESKKKHEEMGFHQGWGIALDQLVEHMKSI
jgi:uncharacterized protein YndB with AHSA1/START domain